MPIYDFVCPHDHIEHDVWLSHSKHQHGRTCPECGQPQVQWYHGKRNGIHLSHSGMYGKFNPGLGEVVHSYGHKQALLKKYDLVESSDRTGGSRSYVPGEYTGNKEQDDRPRERTTDLPGYWGGIPKE